jgi:type I restriction enzyme S subunit
VFAAGQTYVDTDLSHVPAGSQIDGPGIIVKSRGHIAFEFWDGKYSHKNEIWSYSSSSEDLDIRFAYFYLLTVAEELVSLAKSKSVKLPQLAVADTDELRLPVPPIEVQREIVDILDKFTQLEAELEAELEARRKQYEHYRSELLKFSQDTELVTLPDVASNCDSLRKPVTKSARTPGLIPYYGASGVVDYVSDFIFDDDYLLVSEDGANLLARSTPIAFSVSGKCWINNHAHVLKFENYVEQRFVEIYLNSIDLSPFVAGGAQPKLSQSNLNRIPIPAPDFHVKENVVSVLDKLDALVNDISIGLPAEIEARRKQYEYYRDRLLTFDELVV